jgi:hypothetical protein
MCVNFYHKETHAQIPVIMIDMPLWLSLFRPVLATSDIRSKTEQ